MRWERTAAKTMKLSDAREYRAKLSINGGGWRLPTHSELLGIVKKGSCPARACQAIEQIVSKP